MANKIKYFFACNRCRMSRRGTVLLLVTSVAFLIAIVLFFGYLAPSENLKFGRVQYDIRSLYAQAHESLNFIDLAAEHSVILAINESVNCTGISSSDHCKADSITIEEFKREFEGFLKGFNNAFSQNLSADDYKFELEGGYLKGVSAKPLTFKSKFANYSVFPNFKVKVS